MKIESVLVTGANRGIGHEFVRQFSMLKDAPKFIFATYRSPENLQDLKNIQDNSSKSRVILIKMDVNDQAEIEVAKQLVAETVRDRGLTLLINNAGMVQPVAFPKLTPANLEAHFKTNTVGPVMVFQAALNMAMRVIAANVKDKGILVVNMCPGWVKTDMGGREQAKITPEESIGEMMRTFGNLNEEHQGAYMDRTGKLYPF